MAKVVCQGPFGFWTLVFRSWYWVFKTNNQINNCADVTTLMYQSIMRALVGLLISVHPPPKRNAVPSSWFDAECWSAECWVRHLFLLFRTLPSPETRASYFSARRKCCQLLEEKKHNFALGKWTKLLVLSSLRTASFSGCWSLGPIWRPFQLALCRFLP